MYMKAIDSNITQQKIKSKIDNPVGFYVLAFISMLYMSIMRVFGSSSFLISLFSSTIPYATDCHIHYFDCAGAFIYWDHESDPYGRIFRYRSFIVDICVYRILAWVFIGARRSDTGVLYFDGDRIYRRDCRIFCINQIRWSRCFNWALIQIRRFE